MRAVLIFATALVAAAGVSFGLHWAGLVSREAMMAGLAVGFAIAVVGAIANRRRS